MKDKVSIPIAFQIRVDDVGWHNGADDRHISRPSRSGLPRRHHPDDYLVLEKLGKALDMKISCALVLGEWDKDNFLRGQQHITWAPDTWDRKSEIDMEYAMKCFERLESSEYIDYTLHGLMHGFYDNGKLICEKPYYPLVFDSKKNEYKRENFSFLPKEEFKRKIDLFYKIYNSWGFKKKIEAFSSPGGNYGTYEENSEYAEVLKEYGIKYWQDAWEHADINCGVVDGIICISCKKNLTDWNLCDADVSKIEFLNKEGNTNFIPDYVSHWTNYLSINPENNMDNTDAWIDFYKRQAEVFGTIMSKDASFACSQGVYSCYSKVDFTDKKCIIDLFDVDNKNAKGLKNEFYVSIRNELSPKGCVGGKIEAYETKKNFKTYKITRESQHIEILF